VNEDSGNTICGAQTILFLDSARTDTAADVRMIMMSVFKNVSSIIDGELKTIKLNKVIHDASIK
jgi:hypothetical protein